VHLHAIRFICSVKRIKQTKKKQTVYKKARVLQTATAKKITKVTEALERVKL
jgi:hypothetical protein